MEKLEGKPKRKSGRERFHFNDEPVSGNNFTLLSFWQWFGSNILGNALRGKLAEYLVALDVQCLIAVRDEWNAYDLLSPDGVKIEVKSSAYLQSWSEGKLSAISFGIQPAYTWDETTRRRTSELKRQADVYVFCVLNHKEESSVDPMNMAQWDFYVLATSVLDQKAPKQKTISLSPLLKLKPTRCKFGEVGDTIKDIMGLYIT